MGMGVEGQAGGGRRIGSRKWLEEWKFGGCRVEAKEMEEVRDCKLKSANCKLQNGWEVRRRCLGTETGWRGSF